jgi:hypothetical protein
MPDMLNFAEVTLGFANADSSETGDNISVSTSIDRAQRTSQTYKLARGSTAVLAFALTVPASAPVHAQETPPAAISAVCMARPGSNPDSPTFVALVPASEQASMSDKGFSVRFCSIDSDELASYRTKVCHLANDAPPVVQDQFVQEYNISPRALCDMANLLADA